MARPTATRMPTLALTWPSNIHRGLTCCMDLKARNLHPILLNRNKILTIQDTTYRKMSNRSVFQKLNSISLFPGWQDSKSWTLISQSTLPRLQQQPTTAPPLQLFNHTRPKVTNQCKTNLYRFDDFIFLHLLMQRREKSCQNEGKRQRKKFGHGKYIRIWQASEKNEIS